MAWTLKSRGLTISLAGIAGATAIAGTAYAQLRDVTQNPDIAGVPGHPGDSAGIGLSYVQEQGSSPNDHGNVNLLGSSRFIISRDPARAVRRGRQIFQRKFLVQQGQAPGEDDGIGSTGAVPIQSAGLSDACAGCHGRPRGSAGFGGDVATRPDSRDAPHLFGLGLAEQLADEITTDLRAIRTAAIQQAQSSRVNVTRNLTSKGISYGSLTASPNGTVNTSGVRGVNPDLRVRPFFAQGGTISIREFLVGAFNAEMGLESPDIDLIAAQTGPVTTPAGMVLDGTRDFIEAPPVSSPAEDHDGDGVANEAPVSIVDFMEFYLLNYFKPAQGRQTAEGSLGRTLFTTIGCASCHIPNLTVNRDRRIADVETVYNQGQGNPFNNLFATATLLAVGDPAVPAGDGAPAGVRPARGSFVVRNFFADMKRHDLGPNFHERNFPNFVAAPGAPLSGPFSFTTQFITEPLWGVGDTPPYGHDGRSGNLDDVIRRHGGEAQNARNLFVALPGINQGWILTFLRSLVLFGPDDTASNLRPAVPATAGYPQIGHGSIALSALFTTPGAE